MVPSSTESKRARKKPTQLEAVAEVDGGDGRRERIIAAASALLGERGYASLSTLDIANRANVSKRELYRFFDDKQAIIEACIARRAAQMRLSISRARPATPGDFVTLLARFGSAILRELSDPTVVALYRLAISEADTSPKLAAMLDNSGREVIRKALIQLLASGQTIGALGAGEPASMAGEFFGLLWGDLQVRLILGVGGSLGARERERRTRAAVDALMRLHPGVNQTASTAVATD